MMRITRLVIAQVKSIAFCRCVLYLMFDPVNSIGSTYAFKLLCKIYQLLDKGVLFNETNKK